MMYIDLVGMLLLFFIIIVLVFLLDLLFCCEIDVEVCVLLFINELFCLMYFWNFIMQGLFNDRERMEFLNVE